ncbi:serglycin [Sebastes fasciatus]|uniref:serglycin n=1 Tax=Sebastes fasciatus TaxID=394691 RepID=UPI003D9F76E1
MKFILFLVFSCLALHNGQGAPTTAVYKFVRCNPDGDQANCVTQKGPEMAFTPDLPAKLPASTARYLEAEPEEGENPWEEDDVNAEAEPEGGESPWEEDDVELEANPEGENPWEEDDIELETEEEGKPMKSEEGESPVVTEEGSGSYEGSAATYMADWTLGETGSGESWAEKDEKPYKGVVMRDSSRPLVGESKPAEQELREDHLLQL